MRAKRRLDSELLPSRPTENDPNHTEALDELRHDRIFYDGVTGLPIHPFEAPERIDERIEHLGVIYLQIGKFFGFEELFGWEHYDRLLAAVSEVLQDDVRASRLSSVRPLDPLLRRGRVLHPLRAAAVRKGTPPDQPRGRDCPAAHQRRAPAAAALRGPDRRLHHHPGREPDDDRQRARAALAARRPDPSGGGQDRGPAADEREAGAVCRPEGRHRTPAAAAGLPARAAPAGRRDHGLRGPDPRAAGHPSGAADGALRDRARERDGRRAGDALSRDDLRQSPARRRRPPPLRQRVGDAPAPPDLPGRAQPRRDQPQPRRCRRRNLRKGDGPRLRLVPRHPADRAASQA